MGITTTYKKIDKSQILCDDTLKVSIGLSASPDIISNPSDIILILDKSGSMQGPAFESLKNAAKAFIDVIKNATNKSLTNTINSGSRIGIVSFSDNATLDEPLSTSVTDLKTAIDTLVTGGLTNHAAAFQKAMESFDFLSTNNKVILMFTDGKTTLGNPPITVTDLAKANGITIYCIGLSGGDGIDEATLNSWASEPSDTHVAITPFETELANLFTELAENISKTGATNISINEIINTDFIITEILTPTKGSVKMSDINKITWNIEELGVTADEGALLEFFIKHISNTTGTKEISTSSNYTDNEENIVLFDNPSVFVNCNPIVQPEHCPTPKDLKFESCQDFIAVDMGDVYIDSTGRIAQIDVTIKNVCPNKRVALAVILTEVDSKGNEYQRGMKAITIPAHNYPTCKDVVIKCIRFVLPEDLNPNGNKGSLCSERNLKVSFIANNIDTDYECCKSSVKIV